MVGVLIASHGGFADGLLNGAELLVGKQEQVETIGLYHGDSADEFAAKVEEAIEKLDTGEGVYVFVDILGGTPSNVVLKCLEKKRFKAFAGVNMPMMLQTFLMRNIITGGELYESIMEVAGTPMIMLHDLFDEMVPNLVVDDEI